MHFFVLSTMRNKSYGSNLVITMLKNISEINCSIYVYFSLSLMSLTETRTCPNNILVLKFGCNLTLEKDLSKTFKPWR